MGGAVVVIGHDVLLFRRDLLDIRLGVRINIFIVDHDAVEAFVEQVAQDAGGLGLLAEYLLRGLAVAQVLLDGFPGVHQGGQVFVQFGGFFPSAAVRTITPKLGGLMASTIFCNRFLSPMNVSFLDTATILLKGVITMNRSGRDISQLSLGPLEEMGSLRICTSMLGLPPSTSVILPVFMISGSFLNFPKSNDSAFIAKWIVG